MTEIANPSNQPAESLRDQVRSAVIWRSGTQILGQVIAWGATFVVIRLLSPSDYGLFAMTQVVLVLLNMLNGYGLASGIIQRRDVDGRSLRQLFGMLILVNLALGLGQVALAPLAAAYFRQPIVADLLRVQALMFVTTPFIAFPYALLARKMDFRGQAKVNLLSSLAGAITALAGAWGGFGIWTLVAAPMALFSVRAIGMMIAAKAWMLPSFDFRGSGALARYGGLMATSQLFWFLQSQADVFIAGRVLDPHMLGIYTTSLFLTQIFVSKFVPPLNDVAFSAYARIQHDRLAVANAFAKSARIILFAAAPFYFGLFATAEPLVATVLGAQWIEAAPVVRILALAMPFMTLQVLFSPASDAIGHPQVSAWNSATGAILLPITFLVGIQFGVIGLAVAWVVAYPLFMLLCGARTLPLIGLKASVLAAAIAPPVIAGAAMAAIVMLVDHLLPPIVPALRLGILVSVGAIAYGAWIMLFARSIVGELIGLIRKRAI